MWIVCNDGFVSAVQHRDDPSIIIVRSREKKHLEAFFYGLGVEVESSPKGDYPYRVYADNLLFRQALMNKVDDISYDNFKNSISDRTLGNFAHDVWDAGVKRFEGFVGWTKRVYGDTSKY